MANTKSAKKAVHQTKKRTAKNLLIQRNLDYLLKKTRKAIEETKLDEAEKLIKECIKQLDKAVQKKVLKKNTAARQKGRLIKNFNKGKKACV